MVTKMKDMPYIIGLKIRIYPTPEQERLIKLNAGASRFIYNKLVARDKELYELKKVKIYCEPIAKRIEYLESLGTSHSDIINAYPFLGQPDIDSLVIDNAVKNYRTAWKNFREIPGMRIPTFHKKSTELRYQTNAQYHKNNNRVGEGNVRLKDEHHITLPKLGEIRFSSSDRIYDIFSRECETRIGTITIQCNPAGEYYASFQLGSVEPFCEPFEKTGKSVGIDLNLENFYTDSDGQVVDNPKCFAKEKKKLAKAQRKLSRRAERARKEGRTLAESKNYQKQRKKVAKIHQKIARQRREFQDISSKEIVKEYDNIFVEDLKTKNLLKNHSLAGAISDAAWYSFQNKLDYKANMYGKTFAKVPAKNTTQECSECGYVMTGEEKLTLAVREWTCPKCGAHHLRDYNAAVNIKKRGEALLLATESKIDDPA